MWVAGLAAGWRAATTHRSHQRQGRGGDGEWRLSAEAGIGVGSGQSWGEGGRGHVPPPPPMSCLWLLGIDCISLIKNELGHAEVWRMCGSSTVFFGDPGWVKQFLER